MRDRTARSAIRISSSNGPRPFHQPYQRAGRDLPECAGLGMGQTAQARTTWPLAGSIQTIRTQAAILSYSDIFFYCALGAFAVVPFCLPDDLEESRRRTGSGALMRRTIFQSSGFVAALAAAASCRSARTSLRPTAACRDRAFVAGARPSRRPTRSWWAGFRDPTLTALEREVAELQSRCAHRDLARRGKPLSSAA